MIHVYRDPALLKQMDSYVRITVDLQEVASLDNLDALDSILRSWGILGFYCGMPDRQLEENFAAMVADGNEAEGRRSLFRSGGCFRYAGQVKRDGRSTQWLVQWGGADGSWIDVLLNCLEAYHVQVAAIAHVHLSAGEHG